MYFDTEKEALSFDADINYLRKNTDDRLVDTVAFAVHMEARSKTKFLRAAAPMVEKFLARRETIRG